MENLAQELLRERRYAARLAAIARVTTSVTRHELDVAHAYVRSLERQLARCEGGDAEQGELWR